MGDETTGVLRALWAEDGTQPPDLGTYAAAHGRRLTRLAYALTRDAHVAEDLVQTTFLELHRAWDRLGGVEDVDAYARRVLVNRLRDLQRRRAWSERPGHVPVEELRGEPADPVDATAAVDERDRLVALLGQLAPRARAVLALRYLDDRSDAQIADALGLRVASVRATASRALRHLAHHVQEEDR